MALYASRRNASAVFIGRPRRTLILGLAVFLLALLPGCQGGAIARRHRIGPPAVTFLPGDRCERDLVYAQALPVSAILVAAGFEAAMPVAFVLAALGLSS